MGITSISGLVVKFPLAMREPRVRFPADATSLFSVPMPAVTQYCDSLYLLRLLTQAPEIADSISATWAFSSIGRAHA